MKGRTLCAPLLLLAMAAAACMAQQVVPGPDAAPKPVPKRSYASAGVWEVGGSATFQRLVPVEDGETLPAIYTLSVTPYAGWFLFDGVELGVNPLGVEMRRENGETEWGLRFLAAPAYVFRLRGLYPFIEGLAGYTAAITTTDDGDVTRDGFTWGGRVGVKFAVVERGLLTVGVQYLLVTLDPENAAGRYGRDELSVAAGFSVWF